MSNLVKGTLMDVREKVEKIAGTENTYFLTLNDLNTPGTLRYKDFSEFGLSQAGTKLGFPARFITQLDKAGHLDLADEIVETRAKDYLKKNPSIMIRDFNGRHYGVLSDKYSIFDDSEALDIISQNPYLRNAKEVWHRIEPEHFHARFISGNELNIPGDSSPLSMAVFVDNSMVGNGSFTVRFGVYRFACTNGMITGLKEFTVIRQIHKGKDFSDFYAMVNDALSNVGDYEDMLTHMVKTMINSKSAIYDMTEEDAIRYIKDKLNVGEKTAGKVFEMYNYYGGSSKWDLCNAITDAAHDMEFETRLRFERLSSKVA